MLNVKRPFLLNSVEKCKSYKDVESIFSRFIRALPTLDGSTVSHCLNILSKKEINHPKLWWQKVSDILTDKGLNSHKSTTQNTILSTYDVKDVCIILNSFARLNFMFLNLIEASTKIITRQIRNVHTRDLCNVIHSLGKLNQMTTVSSILAKFLKPKNCGLSDMDNLFKNIDSLNEKDFSMLLRVLLINSQHLTIESGEKRPAEDPNKVSTFDRNTNTCITNEVINKFLSSISDKYDNLSDQTLAILTNSLALYGKDENNTLSVLSPIIMLRLRKGCFTPQCIAQIANGYSKLNLKDKSLFSAISERVLMGISEFPPRCLANVLNGFSKVDLFDKQLFLKAIPQFETNSGMMTPQCIGNTINAYSKFSSHLDTRLLVSFFNNLIDALSNFTNFDSFIGQNYANILNGVSKVFVQRDIKVHNSNYISSEDSDPGVCHYIQDSNETPKCRKPSVNEKESLKLIATEQLRMKELFDILCEPIIRIVGDLNHLDVLMIVNSMARCRVVKEELLAVLVEKLKIFRKNYRSLEMTNLINSLSILYSCLLEGVDFKGCASKPRLCGTDGSYTYNNSLKHLLFTCCEYFVDFYMSKLESYKDVRPLDIKLMFNCFARCNIYIQKYCQLLVDKYLKLNQIKFTDWCSIVNYYLNVGEPVPSQLHSHVIGCLGNAKDKILIVPKDWRVEHLALKISELL